MILVSNKGRWPILTSSKRLTSTGFPWTTALLFFTMSVPVLFGIHMAALLLNLFRKLWIPFQYISVRMFLSLSNSPFYSRLVDVDVSPSESDPAHQKAGKSDGPLRVLRCLGVVKKWRLPENSPFDGKVIINHKILGYLLGYLLSIHLCNRGTWLPSDLKWKPWELKPVLASFSLGDVNLRFAGGKKTCLWESLCPWLWR